MRRIAVGLTIFMAAARAATAGEILSEAFNPPLLDETVWCQCQITPSKTPVNLWQDLHDNVTGLTITVNESSLGGKACQPKCKAPPPTTTASAALPTDLAGQIELPESLGPPLKTRAAALSLDAVGGDPYCDEAARRRGKQAGQEGEDPCSQRQELRLHDHLRFPSADVQTYSFRFRMPKDVLDKENSIRWITAQWKQQPYDEENYKESLPDGPSPVVAQRYDDGILWITVQSDLCRCVVAGASPTNTRGKQWANGTPTDCVTIDARKPEGSECEVPPNLVATYENGGVLASPFQTWVEMKYVMKFAAESGDFLDVYQGDKRILRVTGVIGYRPDPKETSLTKFKIGIYRDYIPQDDVIDIDWIKASVEKQAP